MDGLLKLLDATRFKISKETASRVIKNRSDSDHPGGCHPIKCETSYSRPGPRMFSSLECF